MDLVNPDIGLIFWHIVVFLCVYAILAMFAWKPILSALKTREHQIEDSLRSAENARAEMEQIKLDNEYLLKEARIERDKILKDAREEASHVIDHAKAETSDVTKKMIKDARDAIESERKAAVKDIKNLVVSLSIEVAEKILREKLSNNSSQKTLIDKFINEMKID